MKAITLWQPWASLLACGAKKFETRSWPTNYRGPIAIHAGLKHPYHVTDPRKIADRILVVLGADGSADLLNGLPRGAVIATAELIGCYPMEVDAESGCVCITTPEHGREMPSAQEYLFGDWQPGRYAWEFANMKMLPEPIPTKGRQGLWNWEQGSCG